MNAVTILQLKIVHKNSLLKYYHIKSPLHWRILTFKSYLALGPGGQQVGLSQNDPGLSILLLLTEH